LKAQVDAEKESLLNVNVAVHSCIVEQSTQGKGINLKEDVAALYQIWEHLMNKVTKKESLLTEAEQTWKDFQRQLGDLKAEIAADQKKVRSLIELQSGKSSEPTQAELLDHNQSIALKYFFCI
jgi:chromosome segregation ATPase